MTPTRSALVILAIIVVVCCVYFATYLAIVEPTTWFIETEEMTLPEYRFANSYCETLFAPAHWLDRQVRRDVWCTTFLDLKTGKRIRIPELDAVFRP